MLACCRMDLQLQSVEAHSICHALQAKCESTLPVHPVNQDLLIFAYLPLMASISSQLMLLGSLLIGPTCMLLTTSWSSGSMLLFDMADSVHSRVSSLERACRQQSSCAMRTYDRGDPAVYSDPLSSQDTCSICFAAANQVVIRSCRHVLCKGCAVQICHIRGGLVRCPFCRQSIAAFSVL